MISTRSYFLDMLFFKESILILLANSAIGFSLGYFKGLPRVGFLLGLFLGPIGWGILFLLPSQNSKISFRFGTSKQPGSGSQSGFGSQGNGQNQNQNHNHSQNHSASNSNCPRCGQSIGVNEKICGKCGTVIIPVQYQILDDGKPK